MQKFNGTEKQFEEWKIKWRKKLKLCEKFMCCHELMSCGIDVRCGSCSSYEFHHNHKCERICNEVSCDDCSNSKCKYSYNGKHIQARGVE